MVFELTDTLINEVVVNDADNVRSLYNLFWGYEEGNLLLVASPELLDFLKMNLHDRFFQRIINHLQNTILVHYHVLWQTKIVLDNPDQDNHEIAINFFKNTSAIQPPILLCENLDDTRFYSALCKEYFGDIYINTKNGLGGGGSTVADNLENIINNNDRFCLCVVDSDIKYDGAPEGGTYKAIQNKKLKPNSTYDICKLNVHEIENLIPIDKVIQFIKNKRVRQFAQRLKNIDNTGDILFFYDIKDGISKKSIERDCNYYKFANKIYQRLQKPSCNITFDQYFASIRQDHVFVPLCPECFISCICC